MKVVVAGSVKDPSFHRCRQAVEIVAAKSTALEVDVLPLIPVEYSVYLDEQKKVLGGAAYLHRTSPLVVWDGKYVGGEEKFLNMLKAQFGYDHMLPRALDIAVASTEYRKALLSTGHPLCYLDICVGDASPQRLLFELFDDLLPNTCANFMALCTGERGTSENGTRLHYEDTEVHRVVPGGWIQGGDICEGHGDRGESIFGSTFEDESFAVEHSSVGVLGMANEGAHTNASQFYVTLRDTPWMDTRFVAFGRLLEGIEVLKELEGVETLNQRPLKPVIIKACGIVSLDEMS